MPKIADRVKETTTTTGTGTYSLAGAAAGYRAFSSAFTTADTVDYCCEDGTDWEVGTGTLTTGTPWTLARTTIHASSNTGAAVSWGAGTRNIFCTARANLVMQGENTIWVPAGGMSQRFTNGAASGQSEYGTGLLMLKTYDFDQATNEYVQFAVRMPKSWNLGTLNAYFVWSSAISGTSAVVWGIQALAIGSGETMNTAFGSAVTVTQSQITGSNVLMQTAISSDITPAGSLGAGDLVTFQVYRDAVNASDTLAGDARLHGVALIYKTSATNDA